MEITNLIPHIESLIFASDKPLTSLELTELVNNALASTEDKITLDQVESSMEGILEKYSSEFYPFEVRMSGGGWQFLTKKEYHKTVAQLNGDKFLKRLSAAALETLAIVAYKQPVTKGEIEAIRCVSSDYAVQKLLEKALILITGRNEKLPGHPLVYATSKNFMDYFGINSPEDLPKIKEVLAEQLVEPTVIHRSDFEQSETLAVSDEGELVVEDMEADTETTEEGGLNGHSFEMGEATEVEAAEQPVEDEPTEEAIEEYITDEVFKEGDEEEVEEEIEEQVIDEISSEETEGSEAASQDTDSSETSSDNVDNKENDSEKKEEE